MKSIPLSHLDRNPSLIPTIRSMLEQAFTWEHTKEGTEYWLKVFEALDRVAKKGR